MEQGKKFGKWLANLQRESWQMELLISGFSIFLLLNSRDYIEELRLDVFLHSDMSFLAGLTNFFLVVVLLSVLILSINLIIHVFLRGVWIGAVGLSSVTTTADLDKLNYSPFFREKLDSRLQNISGLIITLDRLCSVIFAFTYLLIFMLLSLFLFLMWVSVILAIFFYFFSSDQSWTQLVGTGFLIITMLIGFIYLIDTLSLGFFKRYDRVSKIYFPFYKFIGAITLAGIYRAIYYNLITSFSKNKIRVFLLVYCGILFFIPFVKINYYTFYPDDDTPQKLYNMHYADEIWEGRYFINASIPSKIIREKIMPLFIRYNPAHNEVIEFLCDDYEPSKTSYVVSGVRFRNGLKIGDPIIKEEDPEKLLACLQNLYEVSINDSLYAPDYHYYTHQHAKEQGLITMIDTRGLPFGRNDVLIKRKFLSNKDSIYSDTLIAFPFWLEK